MNKRATVVTTVLVTLTILAALSGALRVAWIIDACELANAGKPCRLTATQKP